MSSNMVTIEGDDNRCPKYILGTHDVPNIWMSPDGRYAVIERFVKESYVAVKVEEFIERNMICTYVDYYEDWDLGVDLKSFSVEWYLQYGFAKLKCFAMESGFDGTVKRFYFDKELYLQTKKSSR